jgi:hypothetical protein
MAGRLRGLLAVVAAAVAFGALSACGGSGYEYVQNDDAGLYFRVPDSWTVLEVEETDSGRPAPAVATPDPWLRLIDRSPTPGAGNYQASLPGYPVGLASVRAVESAEARDGLDYATLRSSVLGEDPLVLADEPGGTLELVDGYDITTDEGLRGQRLVYSVQVEGDRYVTYDHTALVNENTTEVYELLLKCEATCYEANRGEIDDIVDSWTIEQES